MIGRPLADFTFIPSQGLIVFPTFTDNRVMAFGLTRSQLMSYRSDSEWDKNDQKRDAIHQLDKALDAVGIKAGMTVGEVGAGSGYVVLKLSARVGPSGKVYGEDIYAAPLALLNRRAGQKGLANIETVVGEPEDPKMPVGIFDMIFMHATIRSVEKPVELFNALVPCLKPGGKVVVIEGEKGKAVDLDGNPLDDSFYRSREEYIEMFGKTKLKLDRIDDQSAHHHTTFILSKK